MDQVPVTFAGIYGSADKETAWLANKAFASLVSGKSFRSTDLLGGKVSVVLKMPLEALDTTPALARTVIGSLLNAAHQANGNFEGRILYLLDEVARLGYNRSRRYQRYAAALLELARRSRTDCGVSPRDIRLRFGFKPSLTEGSLRAVPAPM
jgi:hypothetical protein